MPVDPIDEQILDRVRARLAAIVTGDTYFYSPGETARDWKNWDEVKSFPFYGVIEGRRGRPIDTFTKVEAQLTVTIVGWIKHDANRRVVLNRAIADVIRAVYTDETWGGLALITDVPEIVTDEAAVVAKPHAYFEITLRIDYMLDRTAV
jgi:YHS domain-containing protein